MKAYKTLGHCILVVLLLLSIPISSHAAVGIVADYVVNNFQVVAVSDLINTEVIEEDNFDFSSLPRFFFIQMNYSNAEADMNVYLHITLNLTANELIDFYSEPFILDDGWNGNGRTYYNSDFTSANWFTENDRTNYADSDVLLDLIEGGLLIAGTLNIRFEVYEVNGNPTPLASTFITRQVYNPTSPRLLSPDDEETVNGFPMMPVMLTWDFSVPGGIGVQRYHLVVVEGPEDGDRESIIESRNNINTKFDRAPSSSNQQLLLGQNVTPGSCLYWQVEVGVPTVLPSNDVPRGAPSNYRYYKSDIFCFYVPENNGMGFDDGFATGGDRGNIIPGGWGEDGDDVGNIGNGGGGDVNDNGLGNTGPDADPEEGDGGADEQGGNDPTLDILRSILPDYVLSELMDELNGYSASDIMIEGVNGRNLSDLSVFVNQPGLEITDVRLEN